MTGQLTANQVAAHLAQLARDLDDLVHRIADAERDAVNKREDYTLAHSRAFLSAEGPMDIRKHEAIQRTHDVRLAAEAAEAIVRGLRRQIDSCKVRIDVGRSVGTALRSELALVGRDGAA